MTQEQIQKYKKQQLYAIRSKGMKYSQQLLPFNCSLQEDKQESLDFGLRHMNSIQYKVYKQYKAQPFGPFRFIYTHNMGYDIIADKDLSKGMLVCQYVGQVVTFRKVLNDNNDIKCDSLFELRAGRNSEQTLYIRPHEFTNMGRFINGINNKIGKHKVNIASARMLVNNKVGVFIATTRQIKKGQSLALDYNSGGLNEYPTGHFV